MKSLKGALIGAGYFAGFQAEAWNRITGARIVAVADTLPDRAQQFASQWNIPNAYTDAAEMLANEKPDFVDIATRPQSHLELVKLAAAHGAHAICQKPMAPTWEECLAMVKVCREAKVQLLIHENWRWQPWYREIKRLLERGRLGQPFHVAFHMRTGDGRGGQPYTVQPYFREMPRFILYEVVVHFIDTFRFLLGEVSSVFCQIGRVNPVIQGEDYALVQLKFHTGPHGLIDANRISGRFPVDLALGTFRLEGDGATIRLSPDGQLWLTEYGKDEVRHEFPTTEQGYKGDSVMATQEHIVNCLNTGQPSESEGEEYLKTVAVVFACYRSAENQQTVAPADWLIAK
ncbi:MAG: Gfo/Idh/MocA family oxidoreductase [Verrucomicrobia bacterium]|nr:Gfo/Idh/MocA family oxidoreductase [Verrucomicrobiota bacterium]